MAGELVVAVSSATFGGAAVAGVKSASFSINGVEHVSRDPAMTGPSQVDVTDWDIPVTLNGESPAALQALAGAAAAALVLNVVGLAGAAKTITLKLVKFNQFGAANLPRRDVGGGPAQFSVSGRAVWGSNDTPATMVVFN